MTPCPPATLQTNKLGWRVFAATLVLLLWAHSIRAAESDWQSYFTAGSQAMNVGDFADGEKLFTEALKVAETMEPRDPRLTRTLCALASAYHHLGKDSQGVALLERALEVDELARGIDDISVARSAMLLAIAYGKVGGKSEQAGELYVRSLAIREKLLGSDHLLVAETLSNLGGNLHYRNKNEEAIKVLERAMNIQDKHAQPDPFNLQLTLNNLAACYRASLRTKDAIPLYERAIALVEREYGKQHYKLGVLMDNLGVAYAGVGRFDDAEAQCKRAISLLEKSFGSSNADLAVAQINLGEIYQLTNRYELAEPLFKQSLTTYEKLLGPSHHTTVVARHFLAAAYANQKKYKLAEQELKACISAVEKSPEAEQAPLIRLLENYAGLCRKLSRPAEAELLTKRADELKRKFKPATATAPLK